MGRGQVIRGGEFLATFKCGAAVNTSTSLDKLTYISASGTVALCTTITQVPIGPIKELGTGGNSAENITVSLFTPTKRGICGGTVTAGGKLCYQTATMYLIDAAGTLTAQAIGGVAITGGATSGEVIEYMPLYYSGIVIA